MAISMEGPRVTRVLPRVEGGPRVSQPASIARGGMALGSGGLVTLFDDRVDTPDGAYPLDEALGARLAPDPRAPLTVNPPLGLALRRHGGAWMTYMPRHEADGVRMLAAIQQMYAARGLTLERFDVPALPEEAVEEHDGWPGERGWRVLDAPEPPVWRPYMPAAPLTEVTPEREDDLEPHGVEAVLLAVTHLSLLYAPVLLPALVWAALRSRAPHVALGAKHALRFQALFFACALPILGAAVALGASRQHPALAVVALILFLMLLLAGAGVAFWAAVRALGGQIFAYHLLPDPYAISR
jgi:uncharacterized Tic20 family protein